MENVSSETWRVRATAWELAAFSFRHPTRELACAIASGEWLAAAREVLEALDVSVPDGLGEDIPGEEVPLGQADIDAFFHRLRVEATRLFVGPGEPACSPYEGVWRAKADGVKPLLFVNPHSMGVERFVHACGLARPEGTNDPLDHIATECELLETLALRAAGAADTADTAGACAPADSNTPGGSAEVAYSQFVEEHLATWVADFCNACETETREPFYRAAAQYLLRLAPL